MGRPLLFVFSQLVARKGAYSASYIFPGPWTAHFLFYSDIQSDARKGAYSASYIFLSPWAAHFFLYSVNQMQEKELIQLVFFPEPMGRPLPFVFSQSATRKGAYSASHISLAYGPPTSFCIQSVSYKKRSIFSFAYFLSPWAAHFLLYSVSQLQEKEHYSASYIFLGPWTAHFLLYSVIQSDARKGAYSASYIFLSQWAAHFFCIQSIRCKKWSIFSFVYFPEPMGRPLLFVFSQSVTRKGAYSASFIFLSPWATPFLLYSVKHKNIN